MPKFEAVPGLMFHSGRQFTCPCGNNEFRVEIGSNPHKYWCECGAWYTEYIVHQLRREVFVNEPQGSATQRPAGPTRP